MPTLSCNQLHDTIACLNKPALNRMIPCSLYIHIPWCIRKCPYCDFNSHKSPDQLPEQAYIQALLADLKHDLIQFPARPIHSIFIGGGTPSLLSAQAYDTLFNEINRLLPFSRDIEITLEANPGTVDEPRFADYRKLGINRLSLGIQSFNPRHLKALGRIHDDEQSHRAIKSARAAGFDKINLDIMHGLPNQSIAEGIMDLQQALDYNPEHLSWYELTIEKNTIFYKNPPILPSEDDAADLEAAGFDRLTKHSFQRYEVSAFCQPNQMAHHNLNYWLFGDYYGIGAGAHGKLTKDDGTIVRTQKQRQPTDYLHQEKAFLVGSHELTEADRLFEFMLNTTRLEQFISFNCFMERTGLPKEALLPQLIRAETKQLININGSGWYVTALGRRYTNDLQALFLTTHPN